MYMLKITVYNHHIILKLASIIKIKSEHYSNYLYVMIILNIEMILVKTYK
jgi:hypothetical protein